MALMDGKGCVITGGAGSLGLASAKALLAEGAKVLLVDQSQDDIDTVAAGLEGEVLTHAADVTQAQDTQAYIAAAVDAWGGVDVLFANAGVSGTNAPITDYPEDIFDQVIDVNIKGSFLALKYGIPHMSSGGSVIVTSSVMGVTARPNSVGYITSKHAVVGMVRCVAREVAPKNIRVNILAPGPIDNDFQQTIEDRMSNMMGIDATAMLNQMIPLGRHSQPEEVAQSILYLASDMSSFSTGSVFMVDGGFTS